MKLISRKKAIIKGLSRYYTGKPCPQGHISERMVATCSCHQCKSDISNKYRETPVGKAKMKQYYRVARAERIEVIMFQNAKKRAKKFNVPLNIDSNYIKSLFPENKLCPILQIPLDYSGHDRNRTPSLDRLIPSRGYTEGNINIISKIANTLKNNCYDSSVFRRLADWLDQKLE